MNFKSMLTGMFLGFAIIAGVSYAKAECIGSMTEIAQSASENNVTFKPVPDTVTKALIERMGSPPPNSPEDVHLARISIGGASVLLFYAGDCVTFKLGPAEDQKVDNFLGLVEAGQ